MTLKIAPDDKLVLDVLQRAVTAALERKRKLGEYAVVWRDDRVVRIEPDELRSTSTPDVTAVRPIR
ncbi:MAG: hypothetical protein ACI8W7_002784 [Gammaproteobacteria bacterium]